MDEYFLKNYESYVKIVVEKAALFDGKNMEVSLFITWKIPNKAKPRG